MINKEYQQFLASKTLVMKNNGIEIDPATLNPLLFPFQKDLVTWALRKGRAAIFADTGLGKSAMQLVWADRIADRALILAPLAVAHQTVREGEKFGISVTYARSMDQSPERGITITNYEMLSHFDLSAYGALVLDESSILKNEDGKTCQRIITTCKQVQHILCCSATPCPNSINEILMHAELITPMTRVEILAAFFIHDDNGWRLKGHAASGPFYKWLASWGMAVKKPSDLGDYTDVGYILPELSIQPVLVKSDYVPEGKLFHDKLAGVQERSQVRKATVGLRIKETIRLIQNSPKDQQWLIWVGLNEEGRLLAKGLPEAVLVEGQDKPEEKTGRLMAFAEGSIRILISKPSIAGMGMNFQSCHNMIFVGLSDSYEDYYQSIRRCYRFGQQNEVAVYIVLSDIEEQIYLNVLKKERDAGIMTRELIKYMAEFEKAEIGQVPGCHIEYQIKDTFSPTGKWHVMLGDSAERLREIPDDSIHHSVFSEPFASLYTYTNSERDLGNCRNYDEFWQQFGYITRELYRVMMPGRIVAAHVQQLPLMKSKDGVIGMTDFRGDNIRHFISQGFIYHGEITIDKNPQAQAIRTKIKGLSFGQLHKDSSWSRPAMADYIILFRKPGDNPVKVIPDVTNEEWIQWASPCWYSIRETDTLNAAEARNRDDSRHIAPLQLETVERLIRLYSNKGEKILTPFLGIGTEVYQAVKLARIGIGCELNPNYYQVAVKNIQEAERSVSQEDLFTLMGVAVCPH